jgi:hypothetical protein
MYFSLNGIEYAYELDHPIPPGEDDLGIGFITLGYAPIILIISAVISIFLAILFKRIFSKLIAG